MKNAFTVSAIFPASAERIYKAWLSSEEHAAFTGSAAKIKPQVGGEFSAWDGYITGKTVTLEPHRRIVQDWRTTEFPEGSPDSKLEVLLKEVEGGTKVTLKHSNIPEGQAEQYKSGWKDFYFAPMRAYFSKP